jgi:DNA-binding MarR family transcriptional regulator
MMLQTKDVDDKYIIFTLIFMLSNQLQAIGDSFFREVSTKQWFVLLMLNIMQDYAPTLNELSEAVGSSHQNVKQLVLKLEQKGYVELSRDKEDARRLRIKATPKSMELNKAYQAENDRFIDRLFGGFKKEDLSITRRVMYSMRSILEGMERDYVRE